MLAFQSEYVGAARAELCVLMACVDRRMENASLSVHAFEHYYAAQLRRIVVHLGDAAESVCKVNAQSALKEAVLGLHRLRENFMNEKGQIASFSRKLIASEINKSLYVMNMNLLAILIALSSTQESENLDLSLQDNFYLLPAN